MVIYNNKRYWMFPYPKKFYSKTLATPEYYSQLRKVFKKYDATIPDLLEDRKINTCRIERALNFGIGLKKDLDSSLPLI